MGVCFYGGPILGNRGRHSFSRAFERKMKFIFIRGALIKVFERQVTEY
jgi:hypothetical protein